MESFLLLAFIFLLQTGPLGYASSEPTEHSNISCSICLERYQETVQRLALPCSHLFHTNCIREWVSNRKNNTCPLYG